MIGEIEKIKEFITAGFNKIPDMPFVGIVSGEQLRLLEFDPPDNAEKKQLYLQLIKGVAKEENANIAGICSEAWLKKFESDEHLKRHKRGSLSEDNSHSEVIILFLNSKCGKKFTHTAEIIRDGESVKLGKWQDMSDGETGGIFPDFDFWGR